MVRSRQTVVILVLGLAIVAALAGGRQQFRTTVASPALPASGRWVPGTLHGDITALLSAPGDSHTLLAATMQGVLRSDDGARHWQQDGAGLQGKPIFVLATTAAGTTVWAGGFDGIVYRRSGGFGVQGAWRPISPVLWTDPALGAVPIYSLAVSALPGQPILAGSMGVIFRGEPDGSNRAWRWRHVWQRPRSTNASGEDGAVTSLLVAPWDPHLVFASVYGANPPLRLSRDGGQSWAPDAAGLPATLPVQDLAPGGAHAHQIFLTTMGGGVWQREANGSWHDISAGLPGHHAMPLLADAGADVLYAGTMGRGVYERQGGGAWRSLGQGLAGGGATVIALAQISGSPSTLLAGTIGGLFRYEPH